MAEMSAVFALAEGERPIGVETLPLPLKEALTEKLAESLAGPLPEATPRRVHGATGLPGKATAIVGMRRAGKTTFLHQMRRERLARSAAREHLPYVNFEDKRLSRGEPTRLPGRGIRPPISRCARAGDRHLDGVGLGAPADGQSELLQVCADASDPTTAEREFRALIEAGEIYPSARRRLLTLTRDGAPTEVPPGITVQPAYEWLLAEPTPR